MDRSSNEESLKKPRETERERDKCAGRCENSQDEDEEHRAE